MKTAFTPGPWNIGKSYTDEIAIRERQGGCVAVACAMPEEESNARLIAAAPELLAALIRLRDCPDVQMESTEPETEEALIQANEAIAKATA